MDLTPYERDLREYYSFPLLGENCTAELSEFLAGIRRVDEESEFVPSPIEIFAYYHYENRFKEGYRWATNAPEEGIKRIVRNLESKGLEIFVGDEAFSETGVVIPGFKAIFVKKLDKSHS
jgi:hypothetical protein